MTKYILIATVAAFAITAPAQGQRADRETKSEERAKERAERQATQRAQRPQRAERQAPQRAERQAPQRAERQAPQRAERQRPQRVERQAPQRAERQAPQRVERQRPQRVERQAPHRVERQRPQRVERQAPQRVERQRPQQVERQRIERAERQRPQRVERQAPQQVERQRIERPRVDGRRVAQERVEQNMARRDNRLAPQQLRRDQRQEMRTERLQERMERRGEQAMARAQQQRQMFRQPSRTVGERVEIRERSGDRNWFDAYAAQRYTNVYGGSQNAFYDYRDDGYLYQIDRRTNLVTALMPLLGGAFSVGQPLPIGYSSNYNVPYSYRSLYYDTPNHYYRYGDGGIYRVDSSTQVIQAIVALLTGRSLGVGQMLPAGYDVYNVPYAYRSSYFDRDDMWYRYNDGYIYGVDPYSRRIVNAYPLSYGYSVGQPVPTYASYGGYGGMQSYGTPYTYNNLYYGQPGYNYQYSGHGIYQVDPTTQIVQALVALVTGNSLNIGQMLPRGYDAYNVPMAYRSAFVDSDDSWYRYNDGYIYEVDPRSRLIQASIPVSYTGYMVGQPVPAGYPGYDVPDYYDGLYYSQPGYDYRYFDGGIYAIDPNSRVVNSQVALLTGQTYGVGQMMPAGYDVYNVPFAYRDRYADSSQHMYRYADGRIYQVDPTTRLIQAVISALV